MNENAERLNPLFGEPERAPKVNGLSSDPGSLRFAHPSGLCSAAIDADHPASLVPGDYLVLGLRTWVYEGRGSVGDMQSEYRFIHKGSPNGIDPERTYSQSEIEAFARAGFLFRLAPVNLVFPRSENGYK